MPALSKHKFESKRGEKRELIMNVALEIFAEYGYHGGSISKIAEKAGISKGLIYNYFESKEELISLIIEDGLDTIGTMLDPNKDGIITRDEMKIFIESMFDLMKDHSRFWTLYLSLMLQVPVLNLVREKLENMTSTYMTMLRKYFETLGHEDPLTDAYIFGSLLDGIGFNLITNSKQFPYDKIKLRLIELYCN